MTQDPDAQKNLFIITKNINLQISLNLLVECILLLHNIIYYVYYCYHNMDLSLEHLNANYYVKH